MSSSPKQNRIEFIKAIVGEEVTKIVTEVVVGDVPSESAIKVSGTVSQSTLRRVSFLNSLANLCDDNETFVKAVANDPDIISVRHLALLYNKQRLGELFSSQRAAVGYGTSSTHTSLVESFYTKLFLAEPSAVIENMVAGGDLSLGSPEVTGGILSFFKNQPTFNIRTTSIDDAFDYPHAFDQITPELVPEIKQQLAILQRLQALISSPTSLPILVRTGLKSAYEVSNVPESQFKALLTPAISSAEVEHIYSRAFQIRFTQEQNLMTALQATGLSGIQAIDGNRASIKSATQSQFGHIGKHIINLHELFDSQYSSECNECHSTLSPAAYLVELLQFLRHNNMKPIPGQPPAYWGYENTVLAKLLARRPDIAKLELTCANTKTAIPYIDLSNEIMESFIVHSEELSNNPNKVPIDAFNVHDELTGELLAEPCNVNYAAYAKVAQAVYPFSLPYHRGIDEIRTFLEYLSTSLYEVRQNFGLNAYYSTETFRRATNSEYLRILPEEYKIICKQSLDGDTENLKPVSDCWGYPGFPSKLLTTLVEVEDEFLPRSGITYVELTEILRTRFINPYYATGWARKVFENLRFSYATLKPKEFQNPNILGFLQNNNSNPLLFGNPKGNEVVCCNYRKDYDHFVWSYFKRSGKIVVLDDSYNNDGKMRFKWLNGENWLIGDAEAFFDRVQRFIRLTRRLGWSFTELDETLGAIADPKEEWDDKLIDWQDRGFRACQERHSDYALDRTVFRTLDITSKSLTEIGAIKKLLEITDIPLINLLAFWNRISTRGENSLFSQLFLPHTIVGTDPVFKTFEEGDFLPMRAKLMDHCQILMATLQFSSTETLKALIDTLKIPNHFNLTSISVLYRFSLLSSALGVRVEFLQPIINLLGVNPFVRPSETLQFFEIWNEFQRAGLSVDELFYILDAKLDPSIPVESSSKLASLQLSKTLYDYLRAIYQAHPDIPPMSRSKILNLEATETDSLDISRTQIENPPVLLKEGTEKQSDDDTLPDFTTSDVVATKLSLVFPQSTVIEIVGLLDGTTVFNTPVPSLTGTIPSNFPKVKYNSETKILTIIGILTAEELNWLSTVVYAPQMFLSPLAPFYAGLFDRTLSGIFPGSLLEPAKKIILSGDIPPSQGQEGTAPAKRRCLYESLPHFIRGVLADRFIIKTMSSAAQLPQEITKLLLEDILKASAPGKSALVQLRDLHAISSSETGQTFYLIPPTSQLYSFITASRSSSITIDGHPFRFTVEPSFMWSTIPIRLTGGRLYKVTLSGDVKLGALQWKATRLPQQFISTEAILPDSVVEATDFVSSKLLRCAVVINKLGLNIDEIHCLDAQGADFDNFNFNSLNLAHIRRVAAYTALRRNLPSREVSLVQVFRWAALNQNQSGKELFEKLADATGWNKDKISQIIHLYGWEEALYFRNEISFNRLQKALSISEKVGVDVDEVFKWAKGSASDDFSAIVGVAGSIKKTIRPRFSSQEWQTVARPLYNSIRESSKNAMIDHLLTDSRLRSYGVRDADQLFEFFLIDVQMSSCFETSRIKQAISTVHLFVQRCLLGLEPNCPIDRARWTTMESQPLYVARRNVFLYPENWLNASLRDNKTSFYKELEAELLQKDLTPEVTTSAVKNYIHKLADIASLHVVGMYHHTVTDTTHVFARTRHAPYIYFYRTLRLTKRLWSSWEKMSVDFPNHVSESEKAVLQSGTYLIPFVWKGRPFVAFPLILKQAGRSDSANKTFNSLGPLPANTTSGKSYWEIKMCWSEYRNGKWSPKQVTTDAVFTQGIELDLALPIFLLESESDNVRIRIEANMLPQKHYIGTFQFSEGTFVRSDVLTVAKGSDATAFHYHIDKHPVLRLSPLLVTSNGVTDPFATPVVFYIEGLSGHNSLFFFDSSQRVDFDHGFANTLAGEVSSNDNLDQLFNYLKTVPSTSFGVLADNYHEQKLPYSSYNWELGFHIPMALAHQLRMSKQYDKALSVLQYIFDPLSTPFWKFKPFQDIAAKDYLRKFMDSLLPRMAETSITEWRDNPFLPHVVARGRPVAYMKWVVITYISILVEYGDYHFRQNTMESIPRAIQLYVLAGHLYGPKPQTMPPAGKIKSQTYETLLDRWDAFENAAVALETLFPFSHQLKGPTHDSFLDIPNIFGLATTRYFCIPSNPQIRQLRDTIDDRLFKLRHCQDIQGVVRKLPLFEPPLDPGMLVQAAAQGVSIASVLGELNSPLPNYRFFWLLHKALELAGELKFLGAALLLAKEKRDIERLTQLRASHDSIRQQLVISIRETQLEEANKAIDCLRQSRAAHVQRLTHYLRMSSEELSHIPGEESDFNEVVQSYPIFVTDGSLKLTIEEKEEMTKSEESSALRIRGGSLEMIASIMAALPSFGLYGTPLGVGVCVNYGPPNIGEALSASARNYQTQAGHFNDQANMAARKSAFAAQLRQRKQGANEAGYQIKNVDKQILAQQVRVQMCEQEIKNQQTIVDQAREAEDFIRTKYTNDELYSWMENALHTQLQLLYNLAFSLAKSTESAYHFERPLERSKIFIDPGHWDPARDGALCGERLYYDLKKLEASYQVNRGHDFELQKFVSLKRLDPIALLSLRETGICEFSLPEVLFDMDFPGHYNRRIKTVSLTIPCVVGPHTNVSCTLRLLEHRYRLSALATNAKDYAEKTKEQDTRFANGAVPIQAIATSSCVNDSGVFEVSFKDERYLPFEGAGVVSKWRLELPSALRQFDYETITDIFLSLHYTSLDGGDKLKGASTDYVSQYIISVKDLARNQGLFTLFDIKNDFPSEWARASDGAPTSLQTLQLSKLVDHFPIFTKSSNITTTDVTIFSNKTLNAEKLKVNTGSGDITLTRKEKVGKLEQYSKGDGTWKVDASAWKLTMDAPLTTDRMWLLMRYIMR